MTSPKDSIAAERVQLLWTLASYCADRASGEIPVARLSQANVWIRLRGMKEFSREEVETAVGLIDLTRGKIIRGVVVRLGEGGPEYRTTEGKWTNLRKDAAKFEVRSDALKRMMDKIYKEEEGGTLVYLDLIPL